MTRKEKLYRILSKEEMRYLCYDLIFDSSRLGLDARFKFFQLNCNYPLKRRHCYLLNSVNLDEISTYVECMPLVLSDIRDSVIADHGEKHYQELIKNYLYGTESEYVCRTADHVQNEDIKNQFKIFNFPLSGGKFALREFVGNAISSVDNLNQASSFLLLENLETRAKFNLRHLLPNEKMTFWPHFMLPFSERPDSRERRRKIAVELKGSIDVNDYPGTGYADDGEFAMIPIRSSNAAIITYGNLVEKGGMLSLLHEIAHAWHASHINSRFLSGFFHSLGVLCDKGISLDKLLSRVNVYDIVWDIAKEESLAWQDACRVLFFLREKGMNLEPRMNDDDINGLVNKCLQTYYSYLRNKLESHGLSTNKCEEHIFVPLNISSFR